MDTYSPDVTCPKCASEELRVLWCPYEPERERVRGDSTALRYLFTSIDKVPPDDRETVPAKPERMEIDCLRCGYHWVMAPRTPEDDG